MPVILHNLLGISLIKPITPTAIQFSNSLRIELFIVYVLGQADRTSQRDSYKTTAPTGIAKDIRDVCCSNERGNTWQRKLLLTIRLTEFDACKLHDILQKTVLRLSRQGIELINVYQQRLCHCPQRILLLTHDKIIVISPLQRLRQKTFAEGRLPITLSGDEQRCHTVTMRDIQPHPLYHHRQKPRVEPFCPPCIIIRNTVCQRLNMILPIPSSLQSFKEIVHRIKSLDKPRLRISPDVFVPRINPIETRLDSNCVTYPFISRHKRFITPCLSDFRTPQGRVISHFILPLKIVEQTTSNIIFKSFRLSVTLIFSFNILKILVLHKLKVLKFTS